MTNKLLVWMISMLCVPAYAARTTSVDPLQKYNFRVTLPGLPSMGFQKCSGLSEENAVIEYDEAGFSHTHKLVGRPKVGEVTLERGEYPGTDLQDQIYKAMTDPNVRQTMIIEKLNRVGKPVRTYKLAEAWASKWEGSDADAGSDDVAIEKITIQFEYYLR